MVMKFGDEPVDLSNPSAHASEEWFKAFYAAVEYWYVDRYGAERVSPHNRKSELRGAVMIHGEAYTLMLPTNRGKVEVEGELAWMFFEDGLGEGEDPIRWIRHAPKLESIEQSLQAQLKAEAELVASTLRFIEFRRAAADGTRNRGAQKLLQASLLYLQQAAKRMSESGVDERGPAWFDLQMANESALKAAIRQITGTHPHSHSLTDLQAKLVAEGLDFDVTRLANWPSFSLMSDRRYGQGPAGSLDELYAAYLISLDLVRAAITLLRPGLKPGFSVLLRYPPWQSRPED
jgi:HEPN domain-containing protein